MRLLIYFCGKLIDKARALHLGRNASYYVDGCRMRGTNVLYV